MISHGVTTAEVKSGYGLDTESELRLLALAAQLGREGPIEIVPTFLGAHAVAPEFRARPDAAAAYVKSVIESSCRALQSRASPTRATSSASAACSSRTRPAAS